MSKRYARKMRDPEYWVGRRVPRDMDSEPWFWDYDTCDNCQVFWPVYDSRECQGLHALLWPMDDADFALQKAVGVEEAQSFCPTCLAEIERDADQIDPNWRHRHGYE